jgi:hypothetical protein
MAAIRAGPTGRVRKRFIFLFFKTNVSDIC